MKRLFILPEQVEVEVCISDDGKYFVRHHTYWYLVHKKQNPHPVHNCIIENLETLVNRQINTAKWAGYKFKFQELEFEDGMNVDAVLIPLNMFEDLIKYIVSNYKDLEIVNDCTQINAFIKRSSLNKLVNIKIKEEGYSQ